MINFVEMGVYLNVIIGFDEIENLSIWQKIVTVFSRTIGSYFQTLVHKPLII